jgi:hypothetical protein
MQRANIKACWKSIAKEFEHSVCKTRKIAWMMNYFFFFFWIKWNALKRNQEKFHRSRQLLAGEHNLGRRWITLKIPEILKCKKGQVEGVVCTLTVIRASSTLFLHPRPAKGGYGEQAGALDVTGASGELGEPTLSWHSSLGRPSELPRWQSMPPHQRLLMHRDC